MSMSKLWLCDCDCDCDCDCVTAFPPVHVILLFLPAFSHDSKKLRYDVHWTMMAKWTNYSAKNSPMQSAIHVLDYSMNYDYVQPVVSYRLWLV